MLIEYINAIISVHSNEIEAYRIFIKEELVGNIGLRKELLGRSDLIPGFIYLTTHETLANDIKCKRYKRKPILIIYDEVHLLSSFSSKVQKRCKLLASFNEGIKYKIGITGTPYQNSPADFFMAYAFFNEPNWIKKGLSRGMISF